MRHHGDMWFEETPIVVGTATEAVLSIICAVFMTL